jgi:CRP-like cAMP-binding protein
MAFDDDDEYQSHRSRRQSNFFDHKSSLSKSTFFAGRNTRFMQELSEALSVELYPAGQNIITQGEEGDRMYFLHRGTAEVIVGQTKVSELTSGTVFGEMALFGNGKRTATIRASELCDCRVINQRMFQRLLKNWPQEKQSFEELISERLKVNTTKAKEARKERILKQLQEPTGALARRRSVVNANVRTDDDDTTISSSATPRRRSVANPMIHFEAKRLPSKGNSTRRPSHEASHRSVSRETAVACSPLLAEPSSPIRQLSVDDLLSYKQSSDDVSARSPPLDHIRQPLPMPVVDCKKAPSTNSNQRAVRGSAKPNEDSGSDDDSGFGSDDSDEREGKNISSLTKTLPTSSTSTEAGTPNIISLPDLSSSRQEEDVHRESSLKNSETSIRRELFPWETPYAVKASNLPKATASLSDKKQRHLREDHSSCLPTKTKVDGSTFTNAAGCNVNSPALGDLVSAGHRLVYIKGKFSLESTSCSTPRSDAKPESRTTVGMWWCSRSQR